MFGWGPRNPTSPPRLQGLFALATPLLLAGLLPLKADISDRWGWSGSWLFPVGSPYAMTGSPADSASGYRVSRGVLKRSSKTGAHDGVDLVNGRGGDPVRAAGNGLVVHVGGKGWNHGYGRNVVIAHRLADGGMVYTVYAHLAPGSVTVSRGELVGAGRMIGRVGMTGRATSPHLHFEVRVPESPAARWENAPVVDPLEFVAARIATPRGDSAWSRPYLEWAECAALIQPGAPGDQRPSRAEWWRALLAATRHPLAAVPAEAESARAALIDMGVLPEYTRGDPQTPLGWSELARDLRRARRQGLRLPFSPVTQTSRREDCRRTMGIESAVNPEKPLAKKRGPERSEMCLALADLAGDPPRRAKAADPAAPKRPKIAAMTTAP